jgi:hypothetical protein
LALCKRQFVAHFSGAQDGAAQAAPPYGLKDPCGQKEPLSVMTSTLGSRQTRGLRRFAVKIRARAGHPHFAGGRVWQKAVPTRFALSPRVAQAFEIQSFFWRVAHQARGKIPLSPHSIPARHLAKLID